MLLSCPLRTLLIPRSTLGLSPLRSWSSTPIRVLYHGSGSSSTASKKQQQQHLPRRLTMSSRPLKKQSSGVKAARTSAPASGGPSFQCFVCQSSFTNVNLLQNHLKESPSCNGLDSGKKKNKVLPGFVAATALTKQRQPELSTKVEQTKKDIPEIQVNGTNGSAPTTARSAKGKGKATPSSSSAPVPIPGSEAQTQTQKTGLGFTAAPSSLSSESPSMARTTSASSSESALSAKALATPTKKEKESGASKRKRKVNKAQNGKGQISIMQKDDTSSAAPDRLQLPVSDTAASSTANKDGLPSPSESIASSTDEIAYVPSSTSTSTMHTPQPSLDKTASVKIQSQPLPLQQEASTSAPELKQPFGTSPAFSASPFQSPFSAFDFLASKMPGLQISGIPAQPQSEQFNPTVSHSPGASKSSEPPLEEIPTIPQPDIPAPPPQRTLPKPLPPPLLSQDSGKRIPQSPLLWGPPRSPAAVDQPTFGSPTVEAYTEPEDEQEAYGRAIAKASHAVGKEAIMLALRERIQAAKGGSSVPAVAVQRPSRRVEIEQEEEQIQPGGAQDLSMVAEGVEEEEEEVVRQQEEPETVTAESATDGTSAESANGDADGVVRQDMANQPIPPTSDENQAAATKVFYSSPPPPVSAFLRDWNPDVHPTGIDVISRTNAINQARQARLYSTSARQQPQQDFVVHENQQETDTSAVQGVLPVDAGNDRGATTAGTTGEEEDSDTASDDSGTSMMLRGVARDMDTRGWEQLDQSEAFTQDASKARLQLERSIQELNKRHKPSFGTITKRREMIYAIRRKLNGLLKEWRHDFQYDILPFGSTAYGLDRDSSDLDLCIIDPKRPDGFRNAFDLYEIEQPQQQEQMTSTDDNEDHPQMSSEQERRRRDQKLPWATDRKTELGLDAIYEPRRLAGVLRRMGFRDVIPIPSAGVPIVKFKSVDGIKADMNANEQLGVRNSALLATYVSFSPLVRPFLIFLKAWAKQRGLNDPSGAHGAMSLSSYSLVLMAIGYMQHIGLVPNLQDTDMVEKSGMKREAFWTKVPNKNAVKPGARGRARYLGDYRAMVVDTTFVRKVPGNSGWKPRYPKKQQSAEGGASHATTSNGASKKSKAKPVGWESDTSDVDQSKGQQQIRNDSKPQSTEVVDLIQGFFDYYLHFPLESRAVSVWAGKPLRRGLGYMPLAVDEQGEVLPQLPKITREEREELYEEEIEEEEEELYKPTEIDAEQVGLVPEQREIPEEVVSEAPAPNEEEESDDEATTKARLAHIDAILKAGGIDTLLPSFEETLLQESRSREIADQALAAREASESPFPETTPTATRFRDIRSPTPTSSSSSAKPVPGTRARGPVATHTGLELHHADENDYLFPFPDVEDPSTFTEPPTWTQKLVVQDPFIHTRNTCLNIIPKVVDRILLEMQRAHDLLANSAPLEQICLNIEKDQEYGSLLTAMTGLAPSRAAQRQQRANHKKEMRKRDEEKQRERDARRALPTNNTANGQNRPQQQSQGQAQGQGIAGRGGPSEARGSSRKQRGKQRYEDLKMRKKQNAGGNRGSGGEQERPRSPGRQ